MLLTGPILQATEKLKKKLADDSSSEGSIGWLAKFKSHGDTHQLDISGEKLNADGTVVADYHKLNKS